MIDRRVDNRMLVIVSPVRGWPQASRDCASRPGLASGPPSDESWLHLLPSDESWLHLPPSSESWLRLLPSDESWLHLPPSDESWLCLPPSSESWLCLPPEVGLERVMTVSPTQKWPQGVVTMSPSWGCPQASHDCIFYPWASGECVSYPRASCDYVSRPKLASSEW
jgi:hypothetical protein